LLFLKLAAVYTGTVTTALKLYGMYWINLEPVVLDMAYSFSVSEVFV
jgi:hypothetical protein